MKEELLLSAAKDQLHLVLSFFPRVDSKASVVLAVNTGMLGYLATRMPAPATIAPWELVTPTIAFVLLGISFVYLYKGAFPDLRGGNESLIYFSEIAKKTETKFLQEFSQLSEAEYVSEFCGQTWRNSQILATKFRCLKSAFVFLAVAVVPWTFSLIEFAIHAANMANVKTP
jgi:hypothetical protein